MLLIEVIVKERNFYYNLIILQELNASICVFISFFIIWQALEDKMLPNK
jgi:hypothetical protein